MTIIAIKDFKIKQSYTKLVEKKIIEYLKDFLFLPLFELIDEPLKATNALTDDEIINEALLKGTIYYSEGEFFAKGKFSNKISRILERWGAKFNITKRSFRLPKDRLPETIRVALAESEIKVQTQLSAIDEFLKDFQVNLDSYIDKMIFDEEVETILDDAGNEVQKNMKRVNVIVPELNDEQKKEIAKTYTESMKYYIKDFEQGRVPEMRKKVQEMTLSGARPDAVAEMLQKEYGINQRKAKFLAQNETGIMLAEYKRVTYTKAGFTKFIWQTIMDGKERELHKELNGKIFSYDDPPIIDERTGQRGLPQQTYNCRCDAIPIRDDNPFSNRVGGFDSVDPTKYMNAMQRAKLA